MDETKKALSEQAKQEVIDHALKELGRLHGELSAVNSQPTQQAEVLTGICIQILAHHAMLSTFMSAKQGEHMDKLVGHTDQLTLKTDTLVRLIDSTEILTRKLVRLTWALLVVSVALFIFAWWQTKILVHEDAGHDAQSRNEATNHGALNTNGK